VGDSAALVPYQVATVAERSNGKRWSTVASPNRGGDDSYLSGVSCLSPSWCAAVGESVNHGVGSQTLVEMWNGKAWRIVASPSLANEDNLLLAVDCVSATWCIAVGETESGGLIERWDGRAWTIATHPTAEQPNSLSSVACTSKTACVAVGSVDESWNGHQWSTLAGPAGLRSVSCPTATVCKAVGNSTKIYAKN